MCFWRLLDGSFFYIFSFYFLFSFCGGLQGGAWGGRLARILLRMAGPFKLIQFWSGRLSSGVVAMCASTEAAKMYQSIARMFGCWSYRSWSSLRSWARCRDFFVSGVVPNLSSFRPFHALSHHSMACFATARVQSCPVVPVPLRSCAIIYSCWRLHQWTDRRPRRTWSHPSWFCSVMSGWYWAG